MWVLTLGPEEDVLKQVNTSSWGVWTESEQVLWQSREQAWVTEPGGMVQSGKAFLRRWLCDKRHEAAGKFGITGGTLHMAGPGWKSCQGHRWHDYCQTWADLSVISSSGSHCSFSIGCLHHPHLFPWNSTTSCSLVLSFLMDCLHLSFILDHDFANIDKNGSHLEGIRPTFVCDSGSADLVMPILCSNT